MTRRKRVEAQSPGDPDPFLIFGDFCGDAIELAGQDRSERAGVTYVLSFASSAVMMIQIVVLLLLLLLLL